jgi:hypothetical protein
MIKSLNSPKEILTGISPDKIILNPHIKNDMTNKPKPIIKSIILI